MNIRKFVSAGIILLAVLSVSIFVASYRHSPKKLQLYWLIPDGVRAEPDVFTIFKWAKDGRLPNIRKMMDNGAYGYSVPVFPSHTPVNFATLLTGAMPRAHGVADGPMHTEGNPLDSVSVGGFRSVARKIPAAWSIFEKSGRKVSIISTPGSTPPEIEKGVVIRGRWGGWGADVHAVNYESRGDGKSQYDQGRRAKLFTFGPKLTQFLDSKPASGWSIEVKTFSVPLEFEVSGWGQKLYGYIFDSTDDKQTNYDRIAFSADKKVVLDTLATGDWGGWHNVRLTTGQVTFDSHYRFHIIKLAPGGFFRIRVYYDNLNEFMTEPKRVAHELKAKLGPMIDFVDNFPAQLIHYPEDRTTFLQEMNLSFDWHTGAIAQILGLYQPDVVIHSVYNPNQMLTSRWWMNHVDPNHAQYTSFPPEERDARFNEVLAMYKRLDGMVGEIMKNSGENTMIVLSSDHGAHVLNKSVRLNNILAKHGYLKFTVDPHTGEPNIDWAASKAVFLQMDGIFLSPDGLAGKWRRAHGPKYEKLRTEIAAILDALRDENGVKVVGAVTKWEDVEEVLDLPKDRVGDLVLSNAPGYGWSEDMSSDLAEFSVPLESGYKQAILKGSTNSVWTPFVIMGPAIKKNVELKSPIRQIDQLPTILRALKIALPSTVEGRPIEGIFE